MNKVNGTITLADKPMPEGFDPSGNAWTVELRYQGRKMTTPYYTGSMLGEPTIADVLESLLSDAFASECSFAEFCGDYGYDEDSRRAEAIWKACVKSGKAFRQFMGVRSTFSLTNDPDIWAKSMAATDWN